MNYQLPVLLFFILELYSFTLAGPVALVSLLFFSIHTVKKTRFFYLITSTYLILSVVDGTTPTDITGIISVILLFHFIPIPAATWAAFPVILMAAYATSGSLILLLLYPVLSFYKNTQRSVKKILLMVILSAAIIAGAVYNTFSPGLHTIKDVLFFLFAISAVKKRFLSFFDLLFFSLLMILYFIITISVTETEFRLFMHLFLGNILLESKFEN